MDSNTCRLLTTAQLAELLQVPEATLNQWAYLGKGPRFFKVGRHRRYEEGGVLAWLETHASDAA